MKEVSHGKGPSALIPSFFASSIAGIISSFSSLPNSAWGVTVQGGLPIPITTPAHGTAFDIAGKNQANLEPTLQSFKIALRMAQNLN